MSPLACAVLAGDDAMVESLVQAKGDVNERVAPLPQCGF